ncbi:hypothetical protein MHYP_G00089770 [Metynnis hypsauchen]
MTVQKSTGVDDGPVTPGSRLSPGPARPAGQDPPLRTRVVSGNGSKARIIQERWRQSDGRRWRRMEGRMEECAGCTCSCSPTELVFHSEDSRSQRRVLTLYNPLRLHPSHTRSGVPTPSLYSVTEAEGSVRSRSCVDIVVRQRDVSRQLWGRRSRFRVDIWGSGGAEGQQRGLLLPHHRWECDSVDGVGVASVRIHTRITHCGVPPVTGGGGVTATTASTLLGSF